MNAMGMCRDLVHDHNKLDAVAPPPVPLGFTGIITEDGTAWIRQEDDPNMVIRTEEQLPSP